MSAYKDSLLAAIKKLCTELNEKFVRREDFSTSIKGIKYWIYLCVRKDELYPVGSIITSTISINPASLYDGTWEAGAYAYYQWGAPVFKAGATPASGEPYVYKRIK